MYYIRIAHKLSL